MFFAVFCCLWCLLRKEGGEGVGEGNAPQGVVVSAVVFAVLDVVSRFFQGAGEFAAAFEDAGAAFGAGFVAARADVPVEGDAGVLCVVAGDGVVRSAVFGVPPEGAGQGDDAADVPGVARCDVGGG